MEIKEDFSLKNANTFRIDVKARYFARVESTAELQELLQSNVYKQNQNYVLGQGSNTLFTKDYPGLVIQMGIQGVDVINESDDNILLEVGAGFGWHELVTYCVEKHWAGIENMALIPGTVGAAAAQNIAAYGQNLVDVFASLQAVNTETGEVESFDESRCQFGYRTSAFKQELQGKYIITSVRLRLNKEFELEANYHERKGRYGSLAEELGKVAEEPYDIRDIYNAVISIRRKKLPDVEKIGTCGSFFKNPVVTKDKYFELAEKIADLQSYPAENLSYERKNWDDIKDDYVKIPAGRLLDELGWRGKMEGHVGVYRNHALCVITDWQARGEDVLRFVEKMKQRVMDAYGVELESEVEIL